MVGQSITRPTKLAALGLLEIWDEAIAIGLGVVMVDVIGDYIASYIGKYVPAKWIDPASEGVLGVLILMFGEIFLPVAMAKWTRFAGAAALGVAIADTIGIMLGFGSSPIRGLISHRSPNPTPSPTEFPSSVNFA